MTVIRRSVAAIDSPLPTRLLVWAHRVITVATQYWVDVASYVGAFTGQPVDCAEVVRLTVHFHLFNHVHYIILPGAFFLDPSVRDARAFILSSFALVSPHIFPPPFAFTPANRAHCVQRILPTRTSLA